MKKLRTYYRYSGGKISFLTTNVFGFYVSVQSRYAYGRTFVRTNTNHLCHRV